MIAWLARILGFDPRGLSDVKRAEVERVKRRSQAALADSIRMRINVMTKSRDQ